MKNIYNIKTRKSKSAYIIFDKNLDTIKYITTKRWKIKLKLLIAKIFGWKIIQEGNNN